MTLGYQDVKDVRQGKFFEVELADADPAPPACPPRRNAPSSARDRDGRQAARQPGHRELPRRGACNEIRGRRLSRIEFGLRRLLRRLARRRRAGRARLAQGHRPERRRRGDSSRRLRARRLPAHRRHRALLARSWPRCKAFADRGGPVLGICNGFQVLLEAGLLPGAMVRNDGIKFVSKLVPSSRRADRHAVHGRVRAGAGAEPADRARRRQLLRAARGARRARSRTGR